MKRLTQIFKLYQLAIRIQSRLLKLIFKEVECNDYLTRPGIAMLSRLFFETERNIMRLKSFEEDIYEFCGKE